jgi:hypothetical protein
MTHDDQGESVLGFTRENEDGNKLFPLIKDDRTLRSEKCSETVKRAWRKRRAEGRTRAHPNQRINYHGRDR